MLQEIAAGADEGFQDTLLMSFFHQIWRRALFLSALSTSWFSSLILLPSGIDESIMAVEE